MQVTVNREKVRHHYKDIPAHNQSLLKTIKNNPNDFYNALVSTKAIEKKEHYDLGSLVETLILYGERQVKEDFKVVMPDAIPSEKVLSMVNQLMDELLNEHRNGGEKPNGNLNNYMGRLVEIAKEHNYQPKWKPETLYQNLYSYCYMYFKLFMDDDHRIIITSEQRELGTKIAANYFASKEGNYLESNYADNNVNIEQFFNHPLLGVVEVCNLYYILKGEIDRLVIDNKDFKITIMDYKCMSEPWKFVQSMFKYKYYYQAAFYYYLVKSVLALERDISKYTIEFMFVVVDATAKERPTLYTISEEVLAECYTSQFRSSTFKTDIRSRVYEDLDENDSFYGPIASLEILTKHFIDGDWEVPFDYQNGVPGLRTVNFLDFFTQQNSASNFLKRVMHPELTTAAIEAIVDREDNIPRTYKPYSNAKDALIHVELLKKGMYDEPLNENPPKI